jgi:tetratricopeptide (TPR) repeat protein
LHASLQAVRRYEEATDALTRAAETFHDLGDRHSEAGAQNNLGAALQGLGQFEEAITAHTNASKTFRDLSDHHGEAQAPDQSRGGSAGAGPIRGGDRGAYARCHRIPRPR